MKSLTFVLLLALVTGGFALAQERRLVLKDGPGRTQLETRCGTCHSLDYVLMNSPFLDRSGWDAEVTKMVKVFGAPVEPDDAKLIVDYLAANFGKS